jgi:predicted ester cyclase
MTQVLRLCVACAGLTLSSGALAGPVVAPGGAAIATDNEAVARRVFDEIFNQRRPEVAAEIYAPDFVNHGATRDVSLAVDQAAARAELAAFPDLHITVELIASAGDLVTVVWRFRGTHTGYGMGLPPTGTIVEMRGITIWRISGGRIREEWSAFNEGAGYMQVVKHVWWRVLGIVLVLGLAIWVTTRAVRSAHG